MEDKDREWVSLGNYLFLPDCAHEASKLYGRQQDTFGREWFRDQTKKVIGIN